VLDSERLSDDDDLSEILQDIDSKLSKMMQQLDEPEAAAIDERAKQVSLLQGIVLDSGRVKEYTRPYDLLQNADSLFYKMVQKLGEAEASALTERAKQMVQKLGKAEASALTERAKQ
ncbi:hypothetical protein Celaphus_00016764, partial [Cervus elaphus hippelaphus]